MLKRKLFLPLVLCACPLLFAQQTAPATSAKKMVIPDKFTNLTVLPSTIPKPQLLGIMKQLSKTTNQRCSGCHTVSDDLTEGNFASDDKPTKEDARKLIRMLMAVDAPAKP